MHGPHWQKDIMLRNQMNSKQRFLRRINLIVVLIMTIAPLVSARAAADVPREKTLIIGFEGGPPPAPENMGLNATGSHTSGTNQVMIENLWIPNYQTGKSDPCLASGQAKWNTDFTQVDIPLRDGITWIDGQPFTSDDIVFFLNIYKT